jgi:hypothetical protein
LLLICQNPINDAEVMGVGIQCTCRNFGNSNTAISFHNATTVVQTSTSIVQKALENISNHHILMAETNSSY